MLTAEEISALTPEQKARYQVLETLFLSEGWGIAEAHLVSRAQEASAEVLTAPDWQTNRLKTGQLQAFMYAARLRESTIREYQGLAEQNTVATTLADEAEHE